MVGCQHNPIAVDIIPIMVGPGHKLLFHPAGYVARQHHLNGRDNRRYCQHTGRVITLNPAPALPEFQFQIAHLDIHLARTGLNLYAYGQLVGNSPGFAGNNPPDFESVEQQWQPSGVITL